MEQNVCTGHAEFRFHEFPCVVAYTFPTGHKNHGGGRDAADEQGIMKCTGNNAPVGNAACRGGRLDAVDQRFVEAGRLHIEDAVNDDGAA